ncbi:MAG: 2-oxo acid dehydrogenase subunit E2, partial [Candidatus Omnitrophica bacterium]|nr:2-oxo acid dehydrogenase subunit E2 [Candidatus Omnitrophota bacterium]
KEILIKEGDEVSIGQVVMQIDGQAAVSAPKGSGQTPVKKEEPKAAPAVQETSKPAVSKPTTTSSSTSSAKDVPAAPSVRRFAREIGIDIAQVPGSGKGGRISTEDVKVFAKQLNSSRGAAMPSGGAVQASRPLPTFEKYGQIERVAMNNIRKKTAQHLTYCWNTIPHVTQFDKADITELEKLRKKYSTKDRKLTITPFLLKVMASALKFFPQFNASIDMDTNEIIYKKYFNIGVAVDTDRGLLVPVVRDVDKKNIFDLSDELNEIAQRARDKKTSLDELAGGCMTLTNLGGIGGTCFTPIVNWPEVSILGVSRGRWEPVYVDGKFISRLLLPLSLSYDHRIIDGADGARFIRWVCEAIEQPFMMELQG